MAFSTHEFKLDLTPGASRPVLYASQGDIGRPFMARCYWNGATWNADAYTVNIRGRKPDETVFDYTATVDGPTVTFETTEQMTIISGHVECELVFSQGGDVIASANFVLMVEGSPYDPDALSESDIPTIGDLIEQTIGGDIRDEVNALIEANPELMLQDNAVTTPKIAAGAVTPSKTSFDFQAAVISNAADSYGQSVVSLSTARAGRASDVLRVATYNTPIRNLLGTGYDTLNYSDWFKNLAALNNTGADVIMLQEISSMNPYTVDVLYTFSGAFPFAYMPIYKRGDVANSDDKAVGRRNYSNAIISAYELNNKSGGIYSYTPSSETRGYAHATIQKNNKVISFYSTHFSLNATQRATEISLLKTILQNDTSDIVMFGADTNIYYANQSSELSDIIALGFTALNLGQNTYPAGSSDRSIDNIYIKGNYTKVSDGVIDYIGLSDFDHDCYYADLKIGG